MLVLLFVILCLMIGIGYLLNTLVFFGQRFFTMAGSGLAVAVTRVGGGQPVVAATRVVVVKPWYQRKLAVVNPW